jgi:signal transduction histidine kinase
VESVLLKETERETVLHKALKALFTGLEMSWTGIYRLKKGDWSDPLLIASSTDLDKDPLKSKWHYLIAGEQAVHSIKSKGWCRVTDSGENPSVWLFWQIEVFGQKQYVLALRFGNTQHLDNSFIPSFGLLASSFGSYVEGRKVEEKLKLSQENAILANRAKSEFLAMMSHEIRTPLNAILGFADLMQKASSKDQLEDYIEIISRSSRELLELMNNILDFSKFESEQLTLEKTTFRLETIAMEALELFTLRAKEKGLKLSYAIDDPTSGYYQGDPFRLKQILTNLLSNAVKFTHQGEIHLNWNVVPVDENLCQWSITVRDSGIGIAEEKLDEIFDPFVQADSSTTREFGGTGLGLAITKRLVERMNGTVRAESALGSGATFKIEIPMLGALPKIVQG